MSDKPDNPLMEDMAKNGKISPIATSEFLAAVREHIKRSRETFEFTMKYLEDMAIALAKAYGSSGTIECTEATKAEQNA